ncbi:MAG: DUF2334 domain-containing protein [bacterium]
MSKSLTVIAAIMIGAARCLSWAGTDGLPAARVSSGATPVKAVLLVNDELNRYSEGRSRLASLLEGMGLPFELCGHDGLGQRRLDGFQLIIMAATAQGALTLDEAAETNLTGALSRGVNILWVGPGIWGTFKTGDLADAFGLRYIGQGWNSDFDISSAEFTNLDGERERLTVYKEVLYDVQPTTATVEQWFLNGREVRSDKPFVTSYRQPGGGQIVYIALQMLGFWKADESADTFARAEVLVKYIRRLTSQGIVAKHAARDGRDAVLILRLEDYVPGGSQMAHVEKEWLTRMRRLLVLTRQEDVPLNIALIQKYRDPYRGEAYAWDSDEPAIQTLRRLAQEAFDSGGTPIVHGYFHQVGAGPGSFSGSDWEMWDPQTRQFLPADRQRSITDGAFAEAARQWRIRPTVWETPHYIGNTNTARAASQSGFLYFTESDTKLFPNRDGYMGSACGLVLNIPETAFNYPKDPDEICRSGVIRQMHMLPRLVRINGLVYFFYHNMSVQQERALENLLTTARRYDLWKPGLETYARFWEARQQVRVTATISSADQQVDVQVEKPFAGFTLAVRLPDGARPLTVRVDGKPVDCKTKRCDAVWFVYPVLPAAETAQVTVRYQP